MTDDRRAPPLPETTAAYLTDPATRAAVDALLAVDADTLPPEIEWNEMGDYFAARAVAELTRAEFALAMHRLWAQVWEPAIPAGWSLPRPDELDEAGQGVSTGVIWDEKVFYVYHRRDGRELYTLVGLDRRQVTIAFSLEQRDKALIKGGLDGFTWRDDGQWPSWMLLDHGVAPDRDGGLDAAPLAAAAKLAISALGSVPGPAPRKPRTATGQRKPKPKPKAPGRPRGR